MSQSDYILLGEISGASGLKGWLKVFSHTAPRVQIIQYSQWFLLKGKESKDNTESDWTAVKVVNGRAQGKNIIAQIEGVNDRNQAELMKGTTIAIHRDQLQKLPKNEYYWKDLIGLAVETTENVQLGKLDWIFNTGSNDVLIIKDEDGLERMLPFLLDDVVVSIELDKSLMVVDWDPEF